MKVHCTGGRPFSFGARPWCDVRAVTSSAQQVFTWHTNKRHYAGCLSGGGKTPEVAARARRAVLIVIVVRAAEGHCTGARSLSIGARPWWDERAVASNGQSAFAWHVRKPHCGSYLSGGGETRELAVRAPCRAGCDRPMQPGRTRYRREACLLRCKTMVRRASCDLQRTTGCRGVTDARAPLRWLHLGKWRNMRVCRARAPCHARCDRSLRYRRALHRREASLFRCKTVVRRASSDLQRAVGIRVARAQAPLRWLSLGRWRNTRACRARAPCCVGCDRPTHYGRALHLQEASFLLCETMVRRASCGLQRTAGIRVTHEQAPLRWLSLGKWQNTRACSARTLGHAGYNRHTCYERALHRREASLLRCKTVVGRASCGLQRAVGVRVARPCIAQKYWAVSGLRKRGGFLVCHCTVTAVTAFTAVTASLAVLCCPRLLPTMGKTSSHQHRKPLFLRQGATKLPRAKRSRQPALAQPRCSGRAALNEWLGDL